VILLWLEHQLEDRPIGTELFMHAFVTKKWNGGNKGTMGASRALRVCGPSVRRLLKDLQTLI
jgi:hypothetical protein